jgi:hypothetical protein
MKDERSSSLSHMTPLLRGLGDSILGDDAGTIGNEALLQAFGQVDKSANERLGRHVIPDLQS